MKNTKFDIRVFVISVLLFFGFAVLYIRAGLMPQYDYEYVGINSRDMLMIMGYDIDGNDFKATGDDPKIIFTTKEYGDTYGIRVTFNENTIPEEFQVYYAESGNDFSEFESLYIEDNENSVVDIVFPLKAMTVSLDIDGEFSLENIECMVHRSPSEVNNTGKYLAALAVSVLIGVVMSIIPCIRRAYEAAAARVKHIAVSAWNNKKRLLLYILFIVLLAGVAVLAEFIVSELLGYDYFNKYEALMIFVGSVIALAAVILRKVTAEKPQYLFAIIVLLLGSFNIISSPKTVGISWDDEIHYGRTVYFSYGATGQITYADAKMIHNYEDIVINNHDYYSRDGRKEWLTEIADYVADNCMFDTDDYAVSYSYVSNVAPAIGLIIGRGLGLSFKNTFMLGKFMNLVLYTCIFYMAISMIKKRGKYLLCVFGLIPTLVFMASSYSYDGWVVSLAVLSYAMLISELQKEDGKITMKKWIGIMVIVILALLPKAVYFPMIFPMLFIGRKKFDDKHRFSSYVLINIASMLLLLSTFIIPMFVGGSGGGDMRGGVDVDSAAQMAFIFGNPLEYTGILLKFIGRYLALNNSFQYLTFLGYYGMASHFTVCIAVFAVVACLDNRSDDNKQGKGFKAMLLFSAFATVCLVATALYISFTPVGYYTVNGCQWRYLLPILFPVLYFMSELRISTTKLNRSLMASLAMIIMALVFLNGIGTLCIRYY